MASTPTIAPFRKHFPMWRLPTAVAIAAIRIRGHPAASIRSLSFRSSVQSTENSHREQLRRDTGLFPIERCHMKHLIFIFLGLLSLAYLTETTLDAASRSDRA